MLKRSITGIIFGICVIGALLYNEWTAYSLFMLVFVLSSWEWLTNFVQTKQSKLIYFSVSIVLLLLMILTAMKIILISDDALFTLCSSSVLFITISIVYTFKIFNFDMLVFPWPAGLFYLFLPFIICIIFLQYNFELNSKLILTFIIINWSNDTFAYFTGRAFGKNKLAESISPKKTIEGSLGGLFGCIVIGFTLNKYCLNQYFDLFSVLLLAFSIWLFGTTGDLFESRLKRSVQIKDSGNLLPGHGGFLDRFDSFYFMVVIAIYLTLFIKF